MSATTLQDIELIKQHSQHKYIKVELLDKNTGVVLENIEGELLNDSGTNDTTSNCRRTYNADFNIKDSSFLVDENNKVWMDKFIRVHCGLLDIRSQQKIWYIIGTYAISEAGYTYDASTNKVSLSLVDKMALLDGTLGGTIIGAHDIKIQRFVNDEYHSAININEDKKSTCFKAGTIITIPVSKTANELGIKFNIIDNSNITDTDINGFRLDYTKHITEYNADEDITQIFSYKQGTEDIMYIDSQNVESVKITILSDINVSEIRLFSGFSDTTISKYCFNGENNIIDTDFTNELKTFDDITIDTRAGRETMLSEVFEASLEQAGISWYQIDDIYETVPYDQEFSVGTTWFDVYDTLIKLYQDIEMFFDEEGMFIVRHYSVINDNDIVIDNEILQPLVTSISYNNLFSTVHNVSEIWGQSIESDVYAENTEDEPYLVKCSNNNFSVNFTDLELNDQGKISNGTILAFKTPLDMVLTDSPTLTVNSIKTAVTNITAIDKIFTCDDFEISEKSDSITGYKIDDKSLYYYKIGCVEIYTEDCLLEDETTNHKTIPENGNTNWSSYGTRSANKIYENSNGDILTIPNIIGSNSSPVVIDDIQFKGTFYNMLNASGMVYISPTNRHTIDLSIRKYCICINAIEGEIYRFYYTNMTNKLYAANSSGVFQKDNRPFIDYSEAVNGINYSDFVAPETGVFYIFYYSTTSGDLGFRLYGMSKVTAKQGEYPIVNYTDEKPVDYTIFAPNASYCFKYNNEKIYYLGQWQVHAVALEVLSIPEKGSDKYNEYVNKCNCSNIMFTQFDSRFAIEKIGIKNQSLSGNDYEDIFTDDLALQRAEYENWQSMRIIDQVTLTTIQIPWLDVNEKITYQLPNLQSKTYTIERISYSNTSETMTIELSTFYPLYM